jgi:hypothetical protein
MILLSKKTLPPRSQNMGQRGFRDLGCIYDYLQQFILFIFVLFLYYVCEYFDMDEPLTQLNQNIDEPDIAKDVVVAPDS